MSTKSKKSYKFITFSDGKTKKIPKDWDVKTLSDICVDIASGGTPSTSNPENFGGKIPWVVISDIKPIITKTKDSLTEKGFKNCSSKLWSKGTVILSTGATIGKVGIAAMELCTKQGITGFVPKEEMNNKFLALWLEYIKPELQKKADGATVKEIYQRDLKKITIPVPPKDEQLKISNIFLNIENTVEITNKIIEKTKILKKGLMQNLFTKGINHTNFKK